MPFIPKPYQRECVKFGVSRAAAGFLLAPGLGKTAIALFVFKILRKLDLVDELFVIAKRRIIYDVWPDEIKKWEGLEHFRYHILHGPKKQTRLMRDVDIRLMNYDGLPWLVNKRGLTPHARQFFKRGKRIMLVCDESSKLKSTSTVRFRRLRKILKFFPRRYILTGSPIPNRLMDIFGQVYALDLGASLGKFITKFRNTYFHPSGYMGYDWELNEGADQKIFKKLRPLILRYGEDELDLPPLKYVNRWVRLPPNARRRYDELEQEFITRVQNHEITAANAAVASGKLRQIANGNIYLPHELDKHGKRRRERRYLHVHDRKLDHLEELIDELNGEPAFVAYEFKHEEKELRKRFPKAEFLNSKTKNREALKIKRDWNAGRIPVLFAHPETAAHGLNMQGSGGIVIFFALTWNFENYDQFIRRIWRQGQRRRVIVYRILARDSVDEIMLAALKRKDRNQQSLLKAMEKHYGVQQDLETEKARGRSASGERVRAFHTRRTQAIRKARQAA